MTTLVRVEREGKSHAPQAHITHEADDRLPPRFSGRTGRRLAGGSDPDRAPDEIRVVHHAGGACQGGRDCEADSTRRWRLAALLYNGDRCEGGAVPAADCELARPKAHGA